MPIHLDAVQRRGLDVSGTQHQIYRILFSRVGPDSLIASLGNTQNASVLRERLALAQDKFLVIKQCVEELGKGKRRPCEGAR